MSQDTCIDTQKNTIPDIALRDTSRWSAFIHPFQAAFVYVQATFCDFRKAFGCIDTSIVFIKLNSWFVPTIKYIWNQVSNKALYRGTLLF